jgi:hypothetical protein
MMICFHQAYTIPVPGLLPYRQKVGFSMNHLGAMFMNDPGALRGPGLCCAALHAAQG